MAQASSTTENKREDLVQRRPWSDLPCELVEKISDGLAILDLLSFRGTCREWRRLASPSKTTINNKLPWFLHYSKDEYPNCNLYDPSSKKIYTKLNIPEFGEGVECIASKGGWLLLYNNSNRSIFFFCPFSRDRIDLPMLPGMDDESLLYNRIATFSSPPTSPDCIVCVGTETMLPLTSGDTNNFAVDVLRRGANEWDFRHESGPRYRGFDMAGSATFWKGSIYFLYSHKQGISFSLETRRWTDHAIVLDCAFRILPVHNFFSYFKFVKRLDNGKLGLKDSDSLSICGTELRGDVRRSGKTDIICIFHDETKAVDDGDEKGIMNRKKHKGVWIQPRFFQLPTNYRW